MDEYAGIAESPVDWVDPVLTGVFLIHTVAFIYLYRKKRHYYTALLIVAFPLLCLYYALRTFRVQFTGMEWIRWGGIGLATFSVILAIQYHIARRQRK